MKFVIETFFSFHSSLEGRPIMIVGDFLSDIPAVSVAKSHLALLRLRTVMIVGAIPSLIPVGIVSP